MGRVFDVRWPVLGPELLGLYDAQLGERPDDAVAHYLRGRLSAPDAALRDFQRAVAIDPDLAWGHHGLAWARAGLGDHRGAVQAEKAALARARGSWERTFFSDSLSRHYVSLGQDARALTTLTERLDDEDVLPLDRKVLSVRAASLELARPYGKASRRGAERAVLRKPLCHQGQRSFCAGYPAHHLAMPRKSKG